MNQFKDKIRNLVGKEPNCSRTIRIRRRGCIYASGEEDAMVYYVKRGQVKLVISTSEGRECVLGICVEGDVFGELCLSGQLTRVETAVATQETCLKAMPYLALLKILKEESMLEGLLRYQAARIAQQQEFIASLLTVNCEQRLAKVLLQMATASPAKGSHAAKIAPKVLLEDLAAMVGTTRSRVGFFLKHFRENGLVEVTGDRSLTIAAEKLRDFCCCKSALAIAGNKMPPAMTSGSPVPRIENMGFRTKTFLRA